MPPVDTAGTPNSGAKQGGRRNAALSYRIEYGYRVGDVLRHIQTVTLVSQGPNQPKLGGRSEIETTTRVKGEQAGIFTIELEVRMLKREGILDQGVPAELGGPVTYTMDRSGTMLSCDRAGLPMKIEAFPKQEIEVGTTWKSEDRSNPAAPTMITSTVEAIEDGPEGARARIVSQSASDNHAEGMKTRVEASQVFHISRGYQVQSTSVVRMRWTDGRTTDIAVENRLAQHSRG